MNQYKLKDLIIQKKLLNTLFYKTKTFEQFQNLIDKGFDINSRDSSGTTPLMIANSSKVAEWLIKAGADVNAKNHFGETSLMKATDPEIIKILINEGADINITDNDGTTVLMKATDPEIIETLINAVADVNIENNNKENALIFMEKLLTEKYEELQIIQEHVKKYEELKGIILQKMKK